MDFGFNFSKDIKDLVSTTKEHAQGFLNSQIKQWLSSPDPSTNYHSALEKRLEGSGRWFLGSSQFSDWKTGKLDGPTLWLHDIPGCGKTYLSCSIIEDLETSQTNESVVLYFFFDFNDQSKQTFENMIRSLVFQLCSSNGQLHSVVEQLYDKKGSTQLSLKDLCDTLQEMVSKLSNVFLVLDALDECTTRESLLKWLTIISQKRSIRAIVASRRLEDIQCSLEEWVVPGNIREFEETPVNEDIRAFVQQRLRHPEQSKLAATWKSRPDILERIETTVVGKSNGMFRWAACQLDALADHVLPHRLFQALDRLPKTLNETYKRILYGIREEDRPDSIRILQFLLYAKRPLSIEEAVDILAVVPGEKPPFHADNRMPDPRMLLKFCSSLITIVEVEKQLEWPKSSVKETQIRLAHFSVKEYLTSEGEDKGSFRQHLESTTAELCITQINLAYLSCLTGETKKKQHI